MPVGVPVPGTTTLTVAVKVTFALSAEGLVAELKTTFVAGFTGGGVMSSSRRATYGRTATPTAVNSPPIRTLLSAWRAIVRMPPLAPPGVPIG